MKGIRSTNRTYSRNYLCYGLVLGAFFVPLTYFILSNQFASYVSNVTIRKDVGHAVQTPSVKDDSLKEEQKQAKQEEDSLETVNNSEETEEVTEVQEEPQQGNERDQKVEKREETKTKDVIKESEETQKRDAIEVQPPEVSKNPEDSRENLEKERLKESINQFNKAEKKDEVQPVKFGGSQGQPQQLKPLCDTSDAKFDLCDVNGDARTIGSASMILLIPPTNNTPTQEYKIKPYSRKYLEDMKPVTVKSLEGPTDAPLCAGRVNYPGIVIALGGLSGNYWHDFTDILIPLYIRSRQFNGEVQFLVTNNQPWWISKYDKIFKTLSRYEIINFDEDYEVRCYPRVLVSYGSYKEFSIDPSRAPNNYSMVDFTKFIRTVYQLKRSFPIKLRKSPEKKPRLMIISRHGSRKFVNLAEITQLCERVGFDVTVFDAKPDTNLAETAKTVNSFDVMLGAHGAGLTNCIFLPSNAVLIQVVPYGKIEHLAKTDFGDPAVDMNLNYLEYSIIAEESTLLDMFGKDHEMIKDPLAIHQRDWGQVGEWYLGKQDIKLDIHRFEPVLRQALQFLQ